MSTTQAPTRMARRSLDFISDDPEQLLLALRLLFGEHAAYICWHTDGDGFHIAMLGSGNMFISGEGVHWQHMDRPVDHLPAVVGEITKWLDSMDYYQKRVICKSRPIEMAYTADPGITLTGYRITTARTLDGQHFMVTITPAWV